MPTQTDVQQLIQGMTPSSVNNGNPNTIYNVSPGPGAEVPFFESPPNPINTSWLPPPVQGVNRSAVLGALNVEPTTQTITPVQLPNIPQSSYVNSGWFTPGAYQQFGPGSVPWLRGGTGGTGTTPGGGWGITRPGTGSGTPVTPPTGTPAPTPAPAPAPAPTPGGGGVGGGGGGIGGDTITGPTHINDGGANQWATVTYDAFGNPTYNFDQNKVNDTLNSYLNDPTIPADQRNSLKDLIDKGLRHVVAPDGSIQWGQLVDIAKGLLGFKGDWYLENPTGGGKFDGSNIIAGVLQRITGLPVNTVMNKIGNQLLKTMDQNGGSVEELPWYQRIFASHAYDNLFNKAQWDATNWAMQHPEAASQNAADWANQAANGTDDTDPSDYNAIYGDSQDYVLPGEQDWSAGSWLNGNNQYNDWWDAGGYDTPSNLGGYDWGGIDWGGIGGSDNGCVTTDTYLGDGRRAGDIKVGDKMLVIDPVTKVTSVQRVTYAEIKDMPCVRVTTKSGVILDCSTTAPIADVTGAQILAPDLLGKLVPVMNGGKYIDDEVTDVSDIGDQEIIHITCGDKFFLAGKYKGKYLMHHNIKVAPSNSSTPSGTGDDEDWWGYW